jgi:protein-S-isoprenylcysteine O-methyltransferase Ste14
MGRVNLVALLHASSGAGALVASLYTGGGLGTTLRFVKLLGYALFAGGTPLFVVSMLFLKRGFLGEVEPVTDKLITTGPYRLVRHPLYLGMILATIGLAVAFRSLWGMLITLALFIPAGLWRARLEEEALARRFGAEWEDYAARTYFILPPVY